MVFTRSLFVLVNYMFKSASISSSNSEMFSMYIYKYLYNSILYLHIQGIHIKCAHLILSLYFFPFFRFVFQFYFCCRHSYTYTLQLLLSNCENLFLDLFVMCFIKTNGRKIVCVLYIFMYACICAELLI